MRPRSFISLLKNIGRNTSGLLLETEVRVFLDPDQQIVITFEMFGETIVGTGVFTVFSAVFPAHIRTGFVDSAFVIDG